MLWIFGISSLGSSHVEDYGWMEYNSHDQGDAWLVFWLPCILQTQLLCVSFKAGSENGCLTLLLNVSSFLPGFLRNLTGAQRALPAVYNCSYYKVLTVCNVGIGKKILNIMFNLFILLGGTTLPSIKHVVKGGKREGSGRLSLKRPNAFLMTQSDSVTSRKPVCFFLYVRENLFTTCSPPSNRRFWVPAERLADLPLLHLSVQLLPHLTDCCNCLCCRNYAGCC